LPDLPHAGNPFGYPSKNEMGDYLERYAEHFDVPVVTGDGVARLTSASSSFLARTSSLRREDSNPRGCRILRRRYPSMSAS
jgi:putative flavoprotein involved in K+ transport